MKISYNRVGGMTAALGAVLTVGVSVFLFIYSDESFRQWAGLASALGMLAPRLLWRYTSMGRWMRKEVLGLIEVLVVVNLALNGIGALGFYLAYQYYDMALHVTGPLSTGVLTALLVGEHQRSVGVVRIGTVLWYALIVTVGAMVLWEFWEYGADALLGTMMFGQPTERYDTLFDILAGGIALIPLTYLIKKPLNTFLWSSSASTKSDDDS